MKNSLDVVSKLLKSKRSPILCAKLLLLARLLLKVLHSRPDAPDSIVPLATKLGNLRQKLLKQLEGRFTKTSNETPDVVEDLTAFCTATSSSPSNALNHFLTLRLNAIKLPQGALGTGVIDRVRTRLTLFTNTIRQSKYIFPDLLGTSLRALGSRALLDDENIQEVGDLRLDVHQRWFVDEIRTYTPWTRHNELSSDAANNQVQSWSRNALDLLSKSIERDLEGEDDLDLILEARKTTLQTWLSSRSSIGNIPFRDSLDKIGSPFLCRFGQLIDTATGDIHDLVETMPRDLEPGDESDKAKVLSSLWEQELAEMDLSDGATSFREAVVHKHLGQSANVSTVVTRCDSINKRILDLHVAFKVMLDTRWDDDYDEELGEESDADETNESNGNLFELLSKTDPSSLLTALKTKTATRIQSLDEKFLSLKDTGLLQANKASAAGMFLLRTIRILRQRLPKLLASIDAPALKSTFAKSLVSSLYTQFTISTCDDALPGFPESTIIMLSRKLRLTALWDGAPPLPLQTSPGFFKLLRSLVKHMEYLGIDIWSPDAVQQLKKESSKRAVKSIQDSIKHAEEDILKRRENPSVEQKGKDEEGAEHEAQDRADDNVAETQQEEQTEQRDNSTSDNEREEVPTNNNTHDETEEISHQVQSSDSNEAEQNFHENRTEPIPTPDHFIQLLFDTYYIQHVLLPVSPPSGSGIIPSYTRDEAEATFSPLIQTLTRRAELNNTEGEISRQRLQKNAREHWRRTYLLFGLLCNG